MKWRTVAAITFSILLAEGVGIVGPVFTAAAIPEWYVYLVKPFFSPPNWLFAPVWTTLYALMGIAAYRVWVRRKQPGAWRALTTYGVQLALNGIWTPVFFGARDPVLGLVVIIALLCMLALTIYRFARIDRTAAWLLAPYIAWVAFATVLNAAIVILN